MDGKDDEPQLPPPQRPSPSSKLDVRPSTPRFVENPLPLTPSVQSGVGSDQCPFGCLCTKMDQQQQQQQDWTKFMDNVKFFLMDLKNRQQNLQQPPTVQQQPSQQQQQPAIQLIQQQQSESRLDRLRQRSRERITGKLNGCTGIRCYRQIMNRFRIQIRRNDGKNENFLKCDEFITYKQLYLAIITSVMGSLRCPSSLPPPSLLPSFLPPSSTASSPSSVRNGNELLFLMENHWPFVTSNGIPGNIRIEFLLVQSFRLIYKFIRNVGIVAERHQTELEHCWKLLEQEIYGGCTGGGGGVGGGTGQNPSSTFFNQSSSLVPIPPIPSPAPLLISSTRRPTISSYNQSNTGNNTGCNNIINNNNEFEFDEHQYHHHRQQQCILWLIIDLIAMLKEKHEQTSIWISKLDKKSDPNTFIPYNWINIICAGDDEQFFLPENLLFEK